ncbi:hypothetical protein [Thermostichus sp. MS-CIW-34]
MKSLCVVAIIVGWIAQPQAECFPVWGQPSKGAIPSCPICWLKEEVWDPSKGRLGEIFQHDSSIRWGRCHHLLDGVFQGRQP